MSHKRVPLKYSRLRFSLKSETMEDSNTPIRLKEPKSDA